MNFQRCTIWSEPTPLFPEVPDNAPPDNRQPRSHRGRDIADVWSCFSCSILLFAVRAVVELIFFTSKSPALDPTRNQPFVGAIVASNLFCMIFHAFVLHPEAGESSRGYLHGGIFIDFIGQTPAPIFRLLSFDLFIFLVDFIMLALIVERVKMTSSTSSTTSSNTAANTGTSTDGNTPQPNDQQDHDAEERGVIRATDDAGNASGQSPVPVPGVDIDEDVHDERTNLLADPGDDIASRSEHPLDTFASGQAIIVDIRLLHTIRDQWQYSTVQRRPAGFVPSPETATFLRQRFGLQVGTDGRVVRVDR